MKKNYVALGVLLSWASAAFGQGPSEDPYGNFYRGQPNSKTWTIDDVNQAGDHFEVGDRFRIVREGNALVMVPIGVMAAKNWIGATPIYRRDDLGFILCTNLAMFRHGGAGAQEIHVLRFELSEDGEELDIEIGDPDEGDTCESLSQHGGSAHALD